MKQVLFAVVAGLIFSFTLIKKGSLVKPFNWLEGSWSMKAKRGTIIESWKASHDSSMLGTSKMISLTGGERVLENLELAFTAGNYYYISRVNEQNNGEAVKFKLTSYSEKGFVAENPAHDFPKRIVYQLVSADSLHAYIDDALEGTKKIQHFYYTKQMK